MSNTVTTPPPPRLFTVSQAAHELNCSDRSIWRLIGLGALKTVRIGRSVRVTRESVEKFIDRGGDA